MLLLINNPFMDPLMNKRTGQFKKVDSNPIEGIDFESGVWLCYPAKVGDLLINIFFHNKFIGLGCALANLFELAEDSELDRQPDAIYAFGVPEGSLDRFGKLPTVFYDDEENNLMVAAVPRNDEFGYFGYQKNMVLTLAFWWPISRLNLVCTIHYQYILAVSVFSQEIMPRKPVI